MKQTPNLKRARGRGRKPHSMGQRTFDSNGPDVKIRGSAAHIYEKYQALARDAHASGDRIGAENYLQHAEHYYRILTAHQTGGNGRGPNGGLPLPREEFSAEDDEAEAEELAEAEPEPMPVPASVQPQRVGRGPRVRGDNRRSGESGEGA